MLARIMKTQANWFVAILCCLTVTASAQTATYKIYAVRFAKSGYSFTAADWAAGGSNTDKVNIAFSIWLIKGANGRNILVDAGFLNDIEDAKEFQLTSYMRPDSALLPLGINAADITDVIITHPHWDHIDGVDMFPKATFWMQKEDYYYFVGRAWQQPKDTGGFAKRDVSKVVELNLCGRLKLVDGDNKVIAPGVSVHTGSKHTYSSQYVLISRPGQRTIIASDNVWIYANLQHLLPAAPGGTMDSKGYVDAMKRMKTLVSNVKYVIPGHDASVYERFPRVSGDIVEIQ